MKIFRLKKILIISPHYPPSNLAAVHRTRLFAQHLPKFGWEPVILTVDEKYYEEKLDWNLYKLLPQGQRIIKVKAFAVTKPRIVGDIGLRGFFQLRKMALQLIKNEKFDFVYIPIPSFYVSLIGPYLNKKTGVKFGIDYIDPWVHVFPGSEKVFSRHWLSTRVASYFEPKAIRNISLITGVAKGYYKGVQERNPKLLSSCVFGAMPYGGSISDHDAVRKLAIEPYLFKKEKGKINLIYAGAMLPKANEPLECVFKVISESEFLFKNIEIHFVGTGKLPNDPSSYNVKPLAEKYDLWQKIIYEYPARIPYLDVLVHLEVADGVFILGSTEPHYTPSKVYQAILAKKPIMAVLHKKSTAVNVIRESKTGIVLDFDGINEIYKIETEFSKLFEQYVNFLKEFDYEKLRLEKFEQYSAQEVTRELSNLLNAAM